MSRHLDRSHLTSPRSVTNCIKFWGEVVLLFIIPALLIRYGVVPRAYTFAVLMFIMAIVAGIVVKERWTFSEIGICTGNFRSSISFYALFAVGGVVLIVGFAHALGRHPLEAWWTSAHFLFAFIPLSIAQEFVFRGFLMQRLRRLFRSPICIVGINALLFAFMHVIYPGQALLFPLAFAGGIGFALIYYLYPNLVLVSCAHMALNFFAVLYSFFSFSNLQT